MNVGGIYCFWWILRENENEMDLKNVFCSTDDDSAQFPLLVSLAMRSEKQKTWWIIDNFWVMMIEVRRGIQIKNLFHIIEWGRRRLKLLQLNQYLKKII